MKPKYELAPSTVKESEKEASIEQEAHYFETMFLTSLQERQKLLKPESFATSERSKKG